MGLILADLLLMLSHGETVKTGAGDVEIDAHQYKLSLRVNALTSARLHCEKTLTPCADASTRKSHSFCLLFPFTAVLLLEKQTKCLNPPKKSPTTSLSNGTDSTFGVSSAARALALLGDALFPCNMWDAIADFVRDA